MEKISVNNETASSIFATKEAVVGVRKCKKVKGLVFTSFMQEIIAEHKALGKRRLVESYSSTLRSFMAFLHGRELFLCAINQMLMQRYEVWLLTVRCVTRNSSSFYMRILRAVYNQAVERGLVTDCRPFKNVYTGVDRTVKRALPLCAIKKIVALDLSDNPRLAFVRDLFLFSFYTRGMSFVDMAYLKKRDLKNGVLGYYRRKTGQYIQVKWERCMQAVVEKYGYGAGEFLLPIISQPGKDERVQYQSQMCMTNAMLKEIAAKVGLSMPLTTYVARHSWASVARCHNIPLSVISEGMGHDSEKTTQIYLASLESSVVDKANRLVIKALLG